MTRHSCSVHERRLAGVFELLPGTIGSYQYSHPAFGGARSGGPRHWRRGVGLRCVAPARHWDRPLAETGAKGEQDARGVSKDGGVVVVFSVMAGHSAISDGRRTCNARRCVAVDHAAASRQHRAVWRARRRGGRGQPRKAANARSRSAARARPAPQTASQLPASTACSSAIWASELLAVSAHRLVALGLDAPRLLALGGDLRALAPVLLPRDVRRRLQRHQCRCTARRACCRRPPRPNRRAARRRPLLCPRPRRAPAAPRTARARRGDPSQRAVARRRARSGPARQRPIARACADQRLGAARALAMSRRASSRRSRGRAPPGAPGSARPAAPCGSDARRERASSSSFSRSRSASSRPRRSADQVAEASAAFALHGELVVAAEQRALQAARALGGRLRASRFLARLGISCIRPMRCIVMKSRVRLHASGPLTGTLSRPSSGAGRARFRRRAGPPARRRAARKQQTPLRATAQRGRLLAEADAARASARAQAKIASGRRGAGAQPTRLRNAAARA